MNINKDISLNTLLNFPEKFPIKIFGLDSEDFRKVIKKIINTHVDKAHLLSWKEKPSSKGNYLSITVIIMAQNKKQLDSIYFALTSNKEVKMAL